MLQCLYLPNLGHHLAEPGFNALPEGDGRGAASGAGAAEAQQQQQYAEPAPAAAPAAPDMTTELTQLAQLHSQGILTDEEFAAKKAQLLGI